jgi:hypothetical protein
MNKGIRASIKGVRIGRPKTPAERERAWKEFGKAQAALSAEAKRNGLTPRKLAKILREIDEERKAARRRG